MLWNRIFEKGKGKTSGLLNLTTNEFVQSLPDDLGSSYADVILHWVITNTVTPDKESKCDKWGNASSHRHTSLKCIK